MKLKDAYSKALKFLTKDHISNPALEARLILSYVLGFDQKEFILELEKGKIPFFKYLFALHLLKKRSRGISVSYLVHKKYFYTSEFFVNRYVLVPRPETELLIEVILEKINKNKFYNIFEVGTGSGIIPVELAKNIPNAKILSIDKSSRALKTASINIKKNNVSEKITLVKKDIFKFETDGKFDIIVSNPPYIKKADIKTFRKNKSLSDPEIALDGGADGLMFYRLLKVFAEKHLTENGFIIFEHGFDQRGDIYKIFGADKFSLESFKDLNGLDRAILIEQKK